MGDGADTGRGERRKGKSRDGRAHRERHRHTPTRTGCRACCSAVRWAWYWCSPACRRTSSGNCGPRPSRSSSSTRPATPTRTCRRSAPPTGRRSRRHPPPHRARPPAHRHHHRPGRHAVLAGAPRRLPLGHGDGGPGGGPAADPLRRLPRPGRLRKGHGAAGGPDRPTAIFAGSDLQALGVLEAARVKGLRVPEDLSVVGYDDVPLAQWSSPPSPRSTSRCGTWRRKRPACCCARTTRGVGPADRAGHAPGGTAEHGRAGGLTPFTATRHGTAGRHGGRVASVDLPGRVRRSAAVSEAARVTVSAASPAIRGRARRPRTSGRPGIRTSRTPGRQAHS